MSERENLLRFAKDLADPDWSLSVPHVAKQTIAKLVAIIEARLRIITTAEELDALPAKSAILDQDGTPWVGDGDKVEPWASVCEDPYGGPIWKNSVDIALPATVLHVGGAE